MTARSHLQQEMASLQRATAAARSKLDSTSSLSPESDENVVLRECLDFREVDEQRQSKYAPGVRTSSARGDASRQQRGALTRVAPPTVRIERRVFQQNDASLRSSVASEDYLDVDVTRAAQSTTSSPLAFRTLPRNSKPAATAPLPRRAAPPPPQTLQKQVSLTHAPASRSSTVTSSSRHHSDSEFHDYYEPPPPDATDEPLYATVAKYVAPADERSVEPASASSRLAATANAAASNPAPSASRGFNASAFARNIPAFATMPRSKRLELPLRHQTSRWPNELYPDPLATSSLGRSLSERRAHPPVPPARRPASWESRIYAVAKTGLKFGSDSRAHTSAPTAARTSCVTVTDRLYTSKTADVAVPVFTLLKGVVNCTVRFLTAPTLLPLNPISSLTLFTSNS